MKEKGINEKLMRLNNNCRRIYDRQAVLEQDIHQVKKQLDSVESELGEIVDILNQLVAVNS